MSEGRGGTRPCRRCRVSGKGVRRAWRATRPALALLAVTSCGRPSTRPAAPPPGAQVPPSAQSAATAPPEVQADPTGGLFPHRAGDTWELRAAVDGVAHRFVVTVLPDTNSGTAPMARLQMKQDGATVQTEAYSVGRDGVYRVAFGPGGKGRVDPPMPILKLPLRDGAVWRWKGQFREAGGAATRGEATFVASAPEAVRTPAGPFRAWRVDQEIGMQTPEGSYPVVNTQWFAAGIGVVKQTTTSPEQRTTAELVKYELTRSDARN